MESFGLEINELSWILKNEDARVSTSQKSEVIELTKQLEAAHKVVVSGWEDLVKFASTVELPKALSTKPQVLRKVRKKSIPINSQSKRTWGRTAVGLGAASVIIGVGLIIEKASD